MGGDEGGHVECLACAESTAMDGAFATEGSAVMVVGGKSGKGGGFGLVGDIIVGIIGANGVGKSNLLEAIGKGAAATKYNLLAGIANGPIMYLSWLDGQAHVWHAPHWLPQSGTTLMLLTEALVPLAGTLVLLTFYFATKPFYKKASVTS